MPTNATTEQRVKDLETEIQYLRAEFRQLANARTGGSHDQIIRPAKTVVDSADDTYPSTGHVAPIVFQDALHEGQETDVTLTDRSADNQGFAGSLSGVLPPVGTEGVAFRYNRQWFLVGQSGSVLVQAPSGGIPARSGIDAGTASCELATKNASDEIELTGIMLDVFNWAAFSACANGSRLGIATVDLAGTWWITAEDCEDTVNSF